MLRRSLRKAGLVIGAISLVIALLAYVPSAAAFTPAILLSFVALFGALAGAAAGAWRTATMTLFVIIATVLASPMLSSAGSFVRVDYLLVGMAVVGLILGVGLYLNYRGKRAQHRTG